MQYALINNEKREAQKGLKGLCSSCGYEVIAKCGSIKIKHWAHRSKINCDSWWEPETPWHREWKNQFHQEYREVTLWNTAKTKFHRADIHTRSGVTIEFQNSYLSYDELKSREEFYPKLIWVVNIQKWKDKIYLNNIPNPHDTLITEFDFVNVQTGLFFYYKPELSVRPRHSCSIREIESLSISSDHFLLSWTYKPRIWFLSKAFVFLDMGDDFLYRLRKREQVIKSFWYVHRIKKEDFISKYSS